MPSPTADPNARAGAGLRDLIDARVGKRSAPAGYGDAMTGSPRRQAASWVAGLLIGLVIGLLTIGGPVGVAFGIGIGLAFGLALANAPAEDGRP